MSDEPAPLCHVGPDFVPCDPADLLPLADFLRSGREVSAALRFPRGTLLPDGRLDLCKQGTGPAGARLVCEAIGPGSQVRHLLMGADGVGDEGAGAISALAGRHRGLQTVYLGCNHITAAGAASLARSLRDHPGLRGLWLKRNPLGPEGAAAVADLVRASSRLRTLDLVNTGIGPQGAHLVLDALGEQAGSVERLYLCGNGLSAPEADAAARLLSSGARLAHLYLSVNRLGDDGARRLAAGLRDNRTLKTLGLGSNGIGPEGLGALVDVLRGHPTLEVLDLGYEPSTQVLGEQANRVGDDGAALLAGWLADGPPLTAVGLECNGISDEGARCLLDALDASDTLTELTLDRQVSASLRGQIQARLRANRLRARPQAGSDPDVEAIRSVYRTTRPGA